MTRTARCDLLKIYYLCGSSNSRTGHPPISTPVVICLKFTTFVVAATVFQWFWMSAICCDLLKIYYLCGSSNSIVCVMFCNTIGYMEY